MGPVLAKIAPQVAHRALGRHRTGKDRHAADIGEGGAGCKSAVACGHVPAPFLRFQTSASRKWTVSTLVELTGTPSRVAGRKRHLRRAWRCVAIQKEIGRAHV